MSISGELIVSRYVAESITRRPLSTAYKVLYAVDEGLHGRNILHQLLLILLHTCSRSVRPMRKMIIIICFLYNWKRFFWGQNILLILETVYIPCALHSQEFTHLPVGAVAINSLLSVRLLDVGRLWWQLYMERCYDSSPLQSQLCSFKGLWAQGGVDRIWIPLCGFSNRGLYAGALIVACCVITCLSNLGLYKIFGVNQLVWYILLSLHHCLQDMILYSCRRHTNSVCSLPGQMQLYVDHTVRNSTDY